MTFGLSATGLTIKRVEDVLASLQARYRTEFGANIKLDPQSVNGQKTGVISEPIADVWALCQAVYASGFLDTATGSALDDLAALAGITRPPATLSHVTLTLGGTPSTVVPIGSRARDSAGNLWETATIGTIGGGGTTTADATPVAGAGPIPAVAGSLTIIDTPVAGWSTVTNADAVLGRDVASDARFRELIRLTMRAGGGSSIEAIRAALLRVSGVEEAIIIENLAPYTDSDGRPPFSFEAVVRGGATQDILDAIWFGKPAGGLAYGSTSGSSVDSYGTAQPVAFSRPTDVDIYFIVQYEADSTFSGTAGLANIRNALLAYGATFTLGRDVRPFEFERLITEPGIIELEILSGTAPGPTSSAIIPITRRQLATFLSANISFQAL